MTPVSWEPLGSVSYLCHAKHEKSLVLIAKSGSSAIEKYSMFDKLIVEDLVHVDNKRYYDEIAYGRQS